MQKKYFYKVFDKSGANLIASWQDATFEGFRKQINSGLGELKINLARKFDNFGENNDVKLNNRFELWVQDTDTPSSLLYSGYISDYEAEVDGQNEQVSVTCLGYATKLARLLYKSGGNYTVTRNSTTAPATAQHIIDTVNTEYVGQSPISYDSNSIGTTTSGMSYTFSTNNCLDALEKCRELAPPNWYFYIGADNVLQFKEQAAIADHTFVFGKHFSQLKIRKNSDKIVNNFLFWNGQAYDASDVDSTTTPVLIKLFSDAQSIADYGAIWETYQDSRVTVSGTMDALGNAYLAVKKSPDLEASVTIIDNNVDNSKGYDIESINPGDTCKFTNLKPETQSLFSDNMIVTGVDYQQDKAIIEIESLASMMERKLNEVRKGLEAQEYGSVGWGN